MRKFIVAGMIVFAGITLTACNSTEDPDFDETTVQYNGEDLDCVTWTGSHNEVGLTCDFVKYHSQTP